MLRSCFSHVVLFVLQQEMQDNGEVLHLRQMVANLQQKLQESNEYQKKNEEKYGTDLDDLRRSISSLKGLFLLALLRKIIIPADGCQSYNSIFCFQRFTVEK